MESEDKGRDEGKIKDKLEKTENRRHKNSRKLKRKVSH
jgi:hypothetical protein